MARSRPTSFVVAAALAASLVSSRTDAEDAPDAAKIADLVGKLTGGDPVAYEAAADALADVGAPAVPALVAVVQDQQNPGRGSAARVLGRIGGDAAPALPALTAMLGDAKAKGHADAAAAIGRIAVGAAKPVDPKLVPPSAAEKSVQAGLDWLARHQNEDGRWSSASFGARCSPKDACQGKGEEPYDLGVTALAVEAFLAAGETHAKGPHAANVESAVRWIRGQQGTDGMIGTRNCGHFLYNHALASLALIDDYRRTGARPLAEPSARAVEFCMKARNPETGWRYEVPPDGGSDTSVTVWMAKVLDVALAAGIEIDHAAMNGALAWVDSVTDEKSGRTGYQQKGGPTARTNEMLKKFPPDQSEAMTAAALVVRLSVGRTRESDPFIPMAESLLAAKAPKWDQAAGTIDLYYWMHGAEGLHRLGGPVWDTWRKATSDSLTWGQRPASTGCSRGSWDTADPWCPEGGRVWITSAAILALVHAADDPSRRPQMPTPVRSATWALEKAVKSADADVRRAAIRALESIRAKYR